MKSYFVALAISLAIAQNIGTTYGEIVDSLFGSVVAKVEQVQRGMVR